MHRLSRDWGGNRPPTARHMCLCCLCQRSVESPEHDLIDCAGSEELIQLQNTFKAEVSQITRFYSMLITMSH